MTETAERFKEERDAHVGDNNMRFNEGKNRFDYINFSSLVPMVKVLEYGAKKYDLNNWKKPPKEDNEHLASMLRHIVALLEGERIDPESKLPHIGHIMCNAMFHSYHELNPQKVVKLDH